MNNKKKMVTIAGTLGVAAVAVAGATFAFFTDTAKQGTSGVAGKVAIAATGLILENPDNINPGDHDETINSPRSTTEHEMNFTVTNEGNKSIMTRNVITISVEDENEAALDASVYSLMTSPGVELVEKFYSVDGNNFVSQKPAEKIVAVRYVTTQVALNGVGTAAEIDVTAPTTVAGVSTKQEDNFTSADYSYFLKLDKNAGEEYELSKITIAVNQQAMQYRNTTDAEWETLFTDTLTAGTLN